MAEQFGEKQWTAQVKERTREKKEVGLIWSALEKSPGGATHCKITDMFTNKGSG